MRTAADTLRHRDFRLAFLSRAAAMMAYLIVVHYLLFILQSRVQLPAHWTAADALAVLTAPGAATMVTGTV